MPDFLQYILTGIGLLAVISYGYGQWRQGRNQSELETSSIYKDRIEALELKVKTQSDDIEKLTEQVKKLRADNEEANRKLLDALNILQGKDPAMAEFIKTGTEYMTSTKPVLETLKKYLDAQVIK